jgi:hypothetical protein
VLPRAHAPWALDSGGFTELSLLGRWSVPPAQYAAEACRFQQEIGQMQWAAIQDWMCEPPILKKTGLTVEEHQRRTIESFLTLRSLAPEVPWLPVLQGWEEADYRRHVAMYARAGVDLSSLPLVGLGSVCRRQHTGAVARLIHVLASEFGLRLHGFGVKTTGLLRAGDALASADSMAWSLAARYSPPLPGCPHRRCTTCPYAALRWRKRLLAHLGMGQPGRSPEHVADRPGGIADRRGQP